MSKIHYIYHSCFAVAQDECLIIYDYWMDPTGALGALLDEYRVSGRDVYFVVSHFHEDHYNAEIPLLASRYENVHLLASYDTVKRRRIDAGVVDRVLRFGDVFECEHFALHAYRSTDVGVSTVTVLRDGETIYHAGDNNNWYFPKVQSGTPDGPNAGRVKVTPDQMEKLFLSIVRDVKADFQELDHVMFPLDPRLGQEMMRGALQFMAAINVGQWHPMHYAAALR